MEHHLLKQKAKRGELSKSFISQRWYAKWIGWETLVDSQLQNLKLREQKNLK